MQVTIETGTCEPEALGIVESKPHPGLEGKFQEALKGEQWLVQELTCL